jgi:Tfp pilus assembly protein PilN
MKAVNLIPADAKRSGGAAATESRLPTYLLLGVLTIAVALVTVYVLSSNKITQRKAQIGTLQAEVTQAQAQAAALNSYAQFSRDAQTRIGSVRQLAQGRFDWDGALVDLSKVVPADTTLSAFTGSTTASSATTPGAAAGPTVELTGCTRSQDDVARLLSRLRLVDGVQTVTLNSSSKTGGSTGGASGGSASSAPAGATGASAGCGANGPSFDLQVAFAGASTAATPAATPTSSTPTTTSSTTGSTGAASSTTGAS